MIEIKRKKVKLSILTALLIAVSLPVIASSAPPYMGEALGKIASDRFADSYYLNHRQELLSRGVGTAGNSPHSQAGLNRSNNSLAKSVASGNINVLTILINFSDKKASVPDLFFDTLMYVDQTGTVNNYYKEVSYNTLNLTTVILPSDIGWKQPSQTYAYYCNSQNGLGSYPQNAQKLVEDAVDLVNPYVDFSDFDNDSDGFVDGLVVVHAGPGAEYTGSNNDIWSHKWAISPRYVDGVYAYTYSMQPEYWVSAGDMTCGVYCHELGHVLGLPDLYDTDYSSEGVGKWSIMAGGSWNGYLGSSPAHFDAWCKIQLGFVTPTVLSSNQTGLSIPNSENNSTIYKIWTNGLPGNEYFLVENRQKTGYDSYIPGSGLMVYHIDDNRSDNDDEWWPGSGSSHYLVAVEPADQLWELEHGIDQGDSGDPFPGSTDNRTFNDISTPNSNSYAGDPTNVSITNISNSLSTMTADIAIGSPQYIDDDKYLIPEKAELYNNYPNPFNAQTTISFLLYADSDVEVDIYDINGRLVENLCNSRLSAGYHNIDWDGVDTRVGDVSTGVYFYRVKFDEHSIISKMLYLK